MCCCKETVCLWFSGFIGAFAFLMLLALFTETTAFNLITFLVLAIISLILLKCPCVRKTKEVKKVVAKKGKR
jgi:membrane protein implicated in regulation of membrane protease activity